MSSPPLVSIALCTYNGSKYLSLQLDTLINQTYNNIEIIAVDDCSTDDTRDVLNGYALKDNRVKLYCNELNIGYTRNFEKAIELCNGDYITLCDQDDLWEVDKIEVMMASVGEHIMVYHDSDFIDEHGNRIGHDTMASKHRMYDGNSCLPVIIGNTIHGYAILFNSKLKQYLRPFDGKFSHDWAIVFAAFNIGSVKYVNKVLVHYRQHQNAQTDFLEQRKKNTSSRGNKNLQRLPVTADWLNYCLKFEHKKEPDLINKACKLFLDLMKGKNRYRCFIFMMKHFHLLFYSMSNKRRGFFSRVNFVRKLCYT
jgi:glycosyltransferase involved in cell wall biosynthesis